MAILKIARMGHPVLQSKANSIDDPTTDDIADLVDDMIDTLEDAGGVGLAAPQVHVALRLVLLQIPPDRLAAEDGARQDDSDLEDDSEGDELTVMINPVITPLSDETADGWEACLSVPGLAGLVPRYTHIKIQYRTLDDDDVTIEAKDFHARVIQHECDHLDGILYPQRMTDLSTFGFTEEISHARAAAADED